MRNEVRRDSSQSSADFVRLVWPVLHQHCAAFRGSGLRMIEGHPQDLITSELDRSAGIDAYERSVFGLRGITSRVQWGYNYRTFTIRMERPNGALTEYAKRLITLQRRDEGYFYPYWMIHAYIDRPGGKLLAVGVAKTIELYQYIEQCRQSGRPCRERVSQEGERFLLVGWEEYRRTGSYLFIAPGRVLSPVCFS